MADEELIASLKNLARQEQKLASLRWTFYRGIIYGFGFFIGSILLVALFLYILSFFDTAPVIGRFIKNILDAAGQR